MGGGHATHFDSKHIQHYGTYSTTPLDVPQTTLSI